MKRNPQPHSFACLPPNYLNIAFFFYNFFNYITINIFKYFHKIVPVLESKANIVLNFVTT